MSHAELNVIMAIGTVVVVVVTVLAFLFFMRWAKAEGDQAKRFREIHSDPDKKP